MGTSSGAYILNHECASTSYLITSTRTSAHNLLPRENSGTYFFGKLMLTGCRLVDCSCESQQNFISDAYQTKSVLVHARFQMFLVTYYSFFTKTVGFAKLKCN